MRAMRQQPNKENIRRSRWAIIRRTYPSLKSTTIQTWKHWVPVNIAPIVYSIPISCKFNQRLNDGTTVELEVLFLALDGPEDEGKLLSLELTGAYLNEGREISWEIMQPLMGRINRFPDIEQDEDGDQTYGPTEPGVIIDSNPPRMVHWLYEKFLPANKPKHWQRFVQPPAVYWDDEDKSWNVNPDAENQNHLAAGYYQQQLANDEEFIKVNLAGEYGMTRLGTPVFSKFSSTAHVSETPLQPHRGTAVLVGIDFGLNVGCVVGQLSYTGLEILDELPATDESLEDFLDQYLVPLLRQRYGGYKVIACGDPAGGGRSAINKMTSIQVMQQRGITTYPAITNAFVKRKEAVDWFLGREKGFTIDPKCTALIEALSAGYVWKQARNNKGFIMDIPDKNVHSHISDSLEYLALYARYGGGGMARPQQNSNVNTPSKKYLWA